MLSDNARRMGPLREKLQWVELWMHRRHLSDKLARRVRAYYTEIWANHKGQLHCYRKQPLSSFALHAACICQTCWAACVPVAVRLGQSQG